MTDLSEKKFGVISLGCDKNRVESEKILSIIKDIGGTIVNDEKNADVVIINTCAFLNESRAEAIDTILECAALKNQNEIEKIVVCGCLPQKYISEIFDSLSEVDLFLGFNDSDKLIDGLKNCYNTERINYVNCGSGVYRTKRVLSTPGHYAYLKIAEGCNNKCTYCLIPKIRGRYVSFELRDLISEAEGLGDISELILVAQDTTRYGLDLYGKRSLVKLLRELSALDNIGSIRLLYCYPELIDDELIEEVRTNEKIIKYLDIPFQHSSDKILKLMNRRGSRKSYLDLISKLRQRIGGIAIRSTFITGFPQEGEEDFENLCAFLKEARLENCGFFTYSREEDTAAYKLKGQILNSVKRQRQKVLYEIQKEISSNILENYIGKKLRVLCDGIDYDKGCFVGRAYFSAPDIDGKVYFSSFNAKQGEYCFVLIESQNGYDLFGKTEDLLSD